MYLSSYNVQFFKIITQFYLLLTQINANLTKVAQEKELHTMTMHINIVITSIYSI